MKVVRVTEGDVRVVRRRGLGPRGGGAVLEVVFHPEEKGRTILR